MFADIQQAYEVSSKTRELADVTQILMDPNVGSHHPPSLTTFRNEPSTTHIGICQLAQPMMTSLSTSAPTTPRQNLVLLARESLECVWSSFYDSLTPSSLGRWMTPQMYVEIDIALTSQSFFSTYRSLFILLASDEADHTPGPIHFPPFGDSQSAYAPHGDIAREAKASTPWVRDFYAAWRDFSTEKRFEWVQKWDVERGVDRSMRRLMEKENKKLREEYRRDYNNTIRVGALAMPN